MSYLKISDLTTKTFSKATVLNESKYRFDTPSKRIFLSYRHADKKYVVPVVDWLQSRGVSVYIDYLDNELQGKTDVEAAKILRTRIQQSEKFILLASKNVSGSKWIPWELGLGDGFDGYKNVIRLPLTEHGFWNSHDYYDIYGYVSKVDSSSRTRRDWAVIYPDTNHDPIWLSDWLIA